MTGDLRVEKVRSPIGKNAKLNELMVLVAVAAADEIGAGRDLDVIKRHAARGAELWEEHLSILDNETKAARSDEALLRQLLQEARPYVDECFGDLDRALSVRIDTALNPPGAWTQQEIDDARRWGEETAAKINVDRGGAE